MPISPSQTRSFLIHPQGHTWTTTSGNYLTSYRYVDILIHSTVFYWTFSNDPHKRGPAAISSVSLHTSSSHSSAPSILTDKINVISQCRTSDQVNVKVEGDIIDMLSLSDEGGLSDNDELGGKEREAAINSPPKGKKHVNSKVTSWLFQ